jgi:organic radical activating enzyme
MAERILIDRLEFYITNVCNLTCSGCNRYNNYKFSGHWRWADAEPILTQWAEKIEIRHPVILGGEPLLNPDIVDWITGLRRLWPRLSGVQVQSNGTRLDLVPGLYDAINHDNWIGISLHSVEHKETLFTRIRNFLKHPIAETENPNHPVGSRYQFIDADQKYIHVWVNNIFSQSNIIEQANGRFGLYNSNPEIAHEVCAYRKFKNYHMIRGRIYKCGPVALMPEFDDQYQFDLSDEDRVIMRGYQGLGVDEFDQRGQEFMDNIDSVVPQCKFCPESYDYKPIVFTNLKPNKI